MAPKSEKTRRENAEVAGFVRKLYEMAGFKSWAEFGREAGGYSSEQMSDWSRGENAPGGFNLMRLIQAAERRHATAMRESAIATDPAEAEAKIAAYHELVAALGLQANGVTDPRQLALSATAAGLVSEIRELLEDEFDEFDARLARLEAAQAPERKTRHRRAGGS